MTGRPLKLFVYGTLAPDAGTRMAGWIAARLLRAEPATAPGRLHAIQDRAGWFPVLLPARSASRVHGVLCALRLSPGERALLDRYEGAEYRRISLPVRTLTGRRRIAEAYAWRVALPARALPIRGGNFARWLRLTRRKAFSAANQRLPLRGRHTKGAHFDRHD